MNKKYYLILNALIVNATIFAQGVTFPSEPAQAPIGGLGLLAAGGAALAYKKFKKKKVIKFLLCQKISALEVIFYV